MPKLTDRQDAYGHAMLDFHLGKRAYEINERDDAYFGVVPLSEYFSSYKDWTPHQKRVIRLARGRVLDIGCGAGRHSLYLQRKGLDVLGIDNSPLAIRVCKLRGLKKAKVMSVTRVSRELGKFDTIIMFGNNFGLFANLERARWLLKKFHRLTGDHTRILAESSDIYQTAEPPHLAYRRRNKRRGRMGGQIRLRVRYKTYATPWFDYLLVSKDEMRAILDGTGWRVTRFIDSGSQSYVGIIGKVR